MNIELTPEVEAAVMRLVGRGVHATPAEVVNTALRLFLDPPEMHRRHDELKAMIQEGVESAEKGELYDLDEVCDDILGELDKAQAQRVASQAK
jgi:putative addiction module CopG family antidote